MLHRRILSIILISAFVISITGISLAIYTVEFGDPFDPGTTSATVDPGVRDPGSPASGVAVPENRADVSVPGWVLPVVLSSIIFALTFLAGSVGTYLRSKRGENLVRADLLDLITVNPGINLSSIRYELQLSQGAVSYHIMKLEKTGKIFSEKGSKERRYYPSSMGYRAAMQQARMDEIGSILSNDTSKNIVEILRGGSKSQNELVKKLDVSPSTIHWHMERMEKAGIIRKDHRGRSVYYDLTDPRDLNT